MFKEEGYEAFLAEKIRRGEEDVKAGRVVTLEDAQVRWQKFCPNRLNVMLMKFWPASMISPVLFRRLRD